MFEMRRMDSLNIISVETEHSNDRSLTAQIDLMFVDNLDIAEYTYYSPQYTESKYKGIYRNELIAAIAKEMNTRKISDNKYSRYQWNLNKGIQLIFKEKIPRKDGKGFTKKEVIKYCELCCEDLESMIRFIFGENVLVSDVMTLEQVINIISIPKFRYYEKLEQILETAIGFYNTRKLGVPQEVQDLYDDISTTRSHEGSSTTT